MQKNTWQKNIKQSLDNADKCNQFFNAKIFKDNKFSLKIPLDFANLINKQDKKDPLLRQVFINHKLLQKGFTKQPLNDKLNSPVSGLIHKYYNRALLITTSSCAIHCSYCFRQNFPYSTNNALQNWQKIATYLKNNQQINEIILSGGDPLNLTDTKLKNLMNKISDIPNIKTIRIHSRTLSVIKNRITKELINIINNHTLNIILVTHINHPNEIYNELMHNLNHFNCQILNQSVLLKGVNDNEKVLIELSNKLWQAKILPYYLHLLDKVKGSEHFMVSDKKAKKLHKNIQKKLSGYLVPKLVRDDNKAEKSILNS